MQAKNFDPELLRLHPNWGHGNPESTLGNSPSSRSVSYKIKLKKIDKKNGRVNHNIRNRESRKAVPAYSTRVKPCRNPIGLVSAAEHNAIRHSVSAFQLEDKINN